MVRQRVTLIALEFRIIGISHRNGAVVDGFLFPWLPANQMVATVATNLLSYRGPDRACWPNTHGSTVAALGVRQQIAKDLAT